MALVDVYCMYNRAKGYPLVSPHDLIKACEMFPALGLPYFLKSFSSGVKVILPSGPESTEEHIALTVHSLIKMVESGLAAHELCVYMNVSVPLAAEQLAIAEKAGLVCRDDSIEGLRFYDNLFMHE